MTDFIKLLDKAVAEMDSALGDFAYLDAELGAEIERLTEMRGEVYERAEKLACALDLNRKYTDQSGGGDQ